MVGGVLCRHPRLGGVLPSGGVGQCRVGGLTSGGGCWGCRHALAVFIRAVLSEWEWPWGVWVQWWWWLRSGGWRGAAATLLVVVATRELAVTMCHGGGGHACEIAGYADSG